MNGLKIHRTKNHKINNVLKLNEPIQLVFHILILPKLENTVVSILC